MSWKEKKSGIYKITNVINNHSYIGSAKFILERWSVHKHQLRLNKHHSKYLQRAVNKYGIDSFKFEVLEECEIEKLLEREQFYIYLIKPEYNVQPLAHSRLGAKWTEEQRENAKGRFSGERGYWYGKEGPTKGRVQTEEEKERRSAANRKTQNDPVVKAKQKERMKLWWAERKKAQAKEL